MARVVRPTTDTALTTVPVRMGTSMTDSLVWVVGASTVCRVGDGRVRPMFGFGKAARGADRAQRPATSVVGMTGQDDARGLVLVVEDEPPIAELQRRYLVDEGFGVHVERDGEGGLAAVGRLHPVAVVLDVGLPGRDGVSVCREMRERGDWTPVLFVTARDDEVDRVLGLEIGADDYLTKPFSPARAGRPGQGDPPAQRRSPGPRAAWRSARSGSTRRPGAAWVGADEVGLTVTEFNLLAA